MATSPVAHALARLGFATKALLYATIGAFALRRAVGQPGPLLDPKAALERLARSALGPALSGAAGVGIACLGAWFVIEALANPQDRRGAWAAVSRFGQAVGGIAYLALGEIGIRILLGLPVGPPDDVLARKGVAAALGIPGGALFAALAGATGVGVGIRQAVQGLSRSFRSSLDLSRAPAAVAAIALFLGAIGFTAQGGLFGAAGALILRATLVREPGQAGATSGVLAYLSRRPYGANLLGAVAIGLLAYAGYAAVEASARRFPRGREGTVISPSAPTAPTDRTP